MKQSQKFLFLHLFLALLLIACNWSCSKDDPNGGNELSPVTYDGFTYHPIKIEEQIWLKENLRTKKFCSGDAIPYALDNGWYNGPGTGANGEWVDHYDDTDPAYCFYKDSMYYANIYGYLYNGYAVFDTRGLCPCEYHIPTKAEWQELINNLGGADLAAAKLKEEGFDHWEVYNFSVQSDIPNNSSGFTALGGGIRDPTQWLVEDVGLKWSGYWWSSTLGQEYPNQDECCMKTADGCLGLHYDEGYAATGQIYFGEGASVRCIKNK